MIKIANSDTVFSKYSNLRNMWYEKYKYLVTPFLSKNNFFAPTNIKERELLNLKSFLITLLLK